MIEIRLTFDSFADASVALAKCAEGQRLATLSVEVPNAEHPLQETAANTDAPTEKAPEKAPQKASRKKRTTAAEKAAAASPAEEPSAVVPQAVQAPQEPQTAPNAPVPQDVQQVSVNQPVANDPTANMPPDMAEAYKSLTRVVHMAGMDAGKLVVSRFGVAKFSDLPATRYAEFATACDTHLSSLNKVS